MPSETVRFWLESIGSVAGIAALAAIALELLRARRADTRDFLFQITEKHQEIRHETNIAFSWEFSNLEEWYLNDSEENRVAWSAVYSFWDLLAVSVRAKTISKYFAAKQFGRPFLRFYEKFSDVMHQQIEIEGGANWFGDIDWLADEVFKLFPGEIEAMNELNEYFEKLKAQAS